ncbi:hypothetical protein MCEMAEM4_02945 [Burkholderiaceae bacterium]
MGYSRIGLTITKWFWSETGKNYFFNYFVKHAKMPSYDKLTLLHTLVFLSHTWQK